MGTRTNITMPKATAKQIAQIAAINQRSTEKQIEFWVALEVGRWQREVDEYLSSLDINCKEKPLMTEEECERIFGKE